MLNLDEVAGNKEKEVGSGVNPSGSAGGEGDRRSPVSKEQMDAFFDSLHEKLKNVPEAEIKQEAERFKSFIEGDLSWADVLHIKPESLEMAAEIGYLQFKNNRFEDAEKCFKALTILDFKNPYYHGMLGAILQRQKRDAEAIVEYTQAIQLKPDDLVSLTNRGEIFMKHGWMKQSKADFDKVISLDAKETDRWGKRARLLREQIDKRGEEKKKGKKD